MKRLDFLKALVGLPLTAEYLAQPNIDLKTALLQAKKTGTLECASYVPNQAQGILNESYKGLWVQYIDESGLMPPKLIQL